MRTIHQVLVAAAFALSLLGEPTNVCAQSRRATSAKKPSPASVKTISMGVLNGKALELVKPNYPPTAKAVNVSGNVIVDVLIGVDARVITAVSRRGHPLLVPASIKAAMGSTFGPARFGVNPARVSGVIIYRYLSSSMNWLELGYSAESIDTLIEFLPTEFSEESSFLDLSRSNPNGAEQTLDTAWSIINSKLGSDEKSQWLISAGRKIATLSRIHWDLEEKNVLFAEIKMLLDVCPENVSRNLQLRMGNLIDPEKAEQFDDNLISLTENLFQLGK
jgi:hypothetical protein